LNFEEATSYTSPFLGRRFFALSLSPPPSRWRRASLSPSLSSSPVGRPPRCQRGTRRGPRWPLASDSLWTQAFWRQIARSHKAQSSFLLIGVSTTVANLLAVVVHLLLFLLQGEAESAEMGEIGEGIFLERLDQIAREKTIFLLFPSSSRACGRAQEARPAATRLGFGLTSPSQPC